MNSEEVAKKTVVALDQLSKEQAFKVAKKLSGKVWGFKVNDLLLAEGCSIITELKAYGNVFADPKLHDIPNTVANSVKRLSASGADIITVHCTGGLAMLEAAREASPIETDIIGVTLLTSLDQEAVTSIYEDEIQVLIMRYARLAIAAGISGIVASPQDAATIRNFTTFNNLKLITPGIRKSDKHDDDQQRTGQAKAALQAGSDLLVVGRPITEHIDPVQGLEEIASA